MLTVNACIREIHFGNFGWGGGGGGGQNSGVLVAVSIYCSMSVVIETKPRSHGMPDILAVDLNFFPLV